MTSTVSSQTATVYPDSDGKPMADNTKQFRWIVTIKENLELLFGDRPDVFVAGDLLWYPVQGNNKLRQAPDAMVVFGRPKGDRGSYRQWNEDDIAPQVVFEILSPGNRLAEMIRKFKFYEQYGVEEYYVYDPDDIELTGWVRRDEALTDIEEMNGWVSPLLQVRFVLGDELELYRPDGQRFFTMSELEQRAKAAEERAETAEERARAAEALLARYRDRFGDLNGKNAVGE
ncbi:Uma2 family endonuclease [Vacuolonema iberomarrocanum]|uniref:Uma2 family endonuclease n=1 Tax=Vacuolonema iberomarrocanum TaxID=3454632 RepID=UPI0019F2A9BF|nr:Uma2 family endonuclease [filamentous cyanobacterium LEGE 07170]